MEAAAQGDARMQRALDSFDELTSDGGTEARRERLRECAEELFAEVADRMPPDQAEAMRAEQVDRIHQVLLKAELNQHRFASGAGPKGGHCTAVYRYTAHMNHSCAPSVFLEPNGMVLRRPGAPEQEDGMAIALALRDISEGQSLCINYGPRELVDWPLEQRRTYLEQKNGFICRCERCMAEETEGFVPWSTLCVVAQASTDEAEEAAADKA